MKRFFIIPAFLLISACAQEAERPVYQYRNSPAISENGITPQVYSIAAGRAVNKFLDGTKVVYEQQPAPTLYIKEIVKADETLPDGFYYADKVARRIIEASRSYRLVNNINDASYYLDVWVDRPSPEAQELTYTLVLNSAGGAELGQWSETLKRLRNDDNSWW